MIRINPEAPFEDEVRRLALALLGRARQDVETVEDDPRAAVHDVRKRFKQVRALLRLIRPADEAFYTSENTRLRDAARGLSPLRDLGAAVETVDRIWAAYEGELGDGAFEHLRAALVAREADYRTGHPDDISNALFMARQAALDSAARFEAWSLDGKAHKVAAKGAGIVRKQVDDALAAARDSQSSGDFHDLRKAVKYYARHLQFIEDFLDKGTARRKQAKALSDRLGDLHDCDVIMRLLTGPSLKQVQHNEVPVFIALLMRERMRLATVTLETGSSLFDQGRKRFERELGQALNV